MQQWRSGSAAEKASFMTYHLTITQKPAYLHAVVTGEQSKANVVGFLRDVLRECADRHSDKVLIEERLEGPSLGLFEVFEIVFRGSIEAAGKLKAIGYVDVHADASLMNFVENVAVNRAMPLRIFHTVPEAEKWLLAKGVPAPDCAKGV
jgi:hypothetical protein